MDPGSCIRIVLLCLKPQSIRTLSLLWYMEVWADMRFILSSLSLHQLLVLNTCVLDTGSHAVKWSGSVAREPLHYLGTSVIMSAGPLFVSTKPAYGLYVDVRSIALKIDMLADLKPTPAGG